MKLRIYFLLLTVGFASLMFSSCGNKATKYYTKGKMKFEHEEYEFAAENLKQAIAYGAPKGEAAYMIAESYRRSNRMTEAAEYYKMALDEGYEDEHVYFYYGYALKAQGHYVNAAKHFQKYIKTGTNFGYLNKAKKELHNLKALSAIAKKKQFFKVQNCKELNSEGIDYSPMFDPKGKYLYFTSSRGEGPMYPGQGTRFTDIFRYHFDGETEFSGYATPLNKEVNDQKTHEATPSFSPDGRTMYFSRSNDGKANSLTQEVDLFSTTRQEDGNWGEPVRLSISETNAWDSNPFVSQDGKTLYFSSNRDGGQGGDDLWKSVWDEENSEWGEPENLGQEVNTPGNEQFPYLREDGTLFFASDGHPGFGGLDIFEYHQNHDGKMEVRNLGRPINGSADDFALIFHKENQGFFCSNREGGMGDDDIYYFGYEHDIDYKLFGQIVGRKLDPVTHKPVGKEVILGNSPVTLMDCDENVLAETVADSNGRFLFPIKPEDCYYIKGTHEGYITRKQGYSTVGKSIEPSILKDLEKDVVFKTKLPLDKITDGLELEFPPIYYDYNKWNIRQDAADVLDQMVAVLKDNPKILVELGSHTDHQGTMNYNDQLSQKRAESAVAYIIKQGIDPSRITAKGYGERQPLLLKRDKEGFKAGTLLNDVFVDAITDSTQQQAALQLNRRTTFRIVGTIDQADNEDIDVVKNGEQEAIVEEEKIKHEEEIIEKHLNKEEE